MKDGDNKMQTPTIAKKLERRVTRFWKKAASLVRRIWKPYEKEGSYCCGAIQIPLQVIAKTTHCRRNFHCLEDPFDTLCKLTPHANPKTLIYFCTATMTCHYKVSFGDGFICTCPVRNVLYDRYRI